MLLAKLLSAALLAETVVLGQAFRPLAGVKSVLRDVVCVMPPLSAH